MEKLRLGLKKVQDEVKRRAVEADDTRLNSYIFARQATGDDAKLLDQYMTHLENMKKIPWYSLQEKSFRGRETFIFISSRSSKALVRE